MHSLGIDPLTCCKRHALLFELHDYLHKINMFISLRKMKILYMIKLVFYTNHCSEHERSQIGSQTVPFNCLSSIKTFLNWSLVHMCVYVTL